jgi:hypothetical protein
MLAVEGEQLILEVLLLVVSVVAAMDLFILQQELLEELIQVVEGVRKQLLVVQVL